MRTFLTSWWKMLLGLLVGYGVGALVILSRPVDYKVTLQYLQALISFPMAIIFVFCLVLASFHAELKAFLNRVEKVKVGDWDVLASLSQEKAADAQQKTEEANKEVAAAIATTATDEAKQVLENLPASEDRDKKIAELQQQKRELQDRLTIALNDSSTRVLVQTPVVEIARIRVQEMVDAHMGAISRTFSVEPARSEAPAFRMARFMKYKEELFANVISKPFPNPSLVGFTPETQDAAVKAAYIRYAHNTANTWVFEFEPNLRPSFRAHTVSGS